mgnify:CR=1 FL=1
MALPLIAEALNITRAEVHGVMSFYHDFREVPAGRHVVKICRAEADRRGLEIELIRTGSRGMIWLESLVEIDRGAGRGGSAR